MARKRLSYKNFKKGVSDAKEGLSEFISGENYEQRMKRKEAEQKAFAEAKLKQSVKQARIKGKMAGGYIPKGKKKKKSAGFNLGFDGNFDLGL